MKGKHSKATRASKKPRKRMRVVAVTPNIEPDVHELVVHVHSPEPPPIADPLPTEFQDFEATFPALDDEPVRTVDASVADSPKPVEVKHGALWHWWNDK